MARRALLILVTISFFISCAQITLRQVGKLRTGMTIEESQKVTTVPPKYTFPLGMIKGDGTIEVHSYILTSGNYKDGQIDAIVGNIKYELVLQEDNTIIWEAVE